MSAECAKIVLLAGKMKMPDRPGHHDYLGGCSLLAFLLAQTPGVKPVVVGDGWPADEAVFDDARALFFYNGGGRKQPAAATPERVERMQALADRGVGMIAIHQAVRYREDLVGRAKSWLGGVHVPGVSTRGHWPSRHSDFPDHPVTRGVAAWEIRDGWLNGIRFVDGMAGITPLVWSSAERRGASAGGTPDVVSWIYERPNGGRSFCFTGLDAHSAWSHAGVRRLVANAVLWSAHVPVPDQGAPCAIGDAELQGYLTPRGSTGERLLALLGRAAKRLTR
jgi:Trehalose utilisation